MARKSRKAKPQGESVTIESPVKTAVGYVRLSVQDKDGKGDSIETQKQIISQYLDEYPDFYLSKFYVDDGVSGSTYDRPGFNEMLRDAEKGKFSCILVKDVSRLGREHIDTGYYVEKFFPSIGIRFLSINDHYDSERDGLDLAFLFESFMSEAYSVDIGRSVKSVLRNQMNRGEYVGSRPPYGYLKSPKDEHKLIVDESAAAVVKQIFQWSADGKSILTIVRSLNNAGVLAPSHHWFDIGMIQNVEMLGKECWQSRTVRKILTNVLYTGSMAQGKTKIVRHKQVPVQPDDWLCIENTHPAIISQELFSSIQQALAGNAENGPRKQNGHYTPNLLRGKIFCGHCGGRLDRKKNHQHYIYRCVVNYTAPGSCTGNSIHEDSLFATISKALLEYAETVDMESLGLEASQQIEMELTRLQVETSYIENRGRELYEAFVTGKITSKEFGDLRAKLACEKVPQEERWLQLGAERSNQKVLARERRELHNVIAEFQRTRLLTQAVADSLIKKITAFSDGRVHVGLASESLTHRKMSSTD